MSTLTRVSLNPHSRGGRKLLTQPQALHAAVRGCFPTPLEESRGRVLWRVDTHHDSHTLYIVGPEAPNTRALVEQAGWFEQPAQTADYAPFLSALNEGQRWAFRLTANTVKSLPANGSKRGKVVPRTSEPQQREWLRARTERNGFSLVAGEPSAEVDEPGSEQLRVSRRLDLAFRKGGEAASGPKNVALRIAQFDGVLEITNANSLRQALVHGIGPAKAYGCGLLTLAPAAQ